MPRINSRNNKALWEHQKKIRLNPDVFLRWRLEKQFSMRRAAQVCNVSEVTYRRVEKGQRVELLTAARVAKAIRIPVDKLILES